MLLNAFHGGTADMTDPNYLAGLSDKLGGDSA